MGKNESGGKSERKSSQDGEENLKESCSVHSSSLCPSSSYQNTLVYQVVYIKSSIFHPKICFQLLTSLDSFSFNLFPLAFLLPTHLSSPFLSPYKNKYQFVFLPQYYFDTFFRLFCFASSHLNSPSEIQIPHFLLPKKATPTSTTLAHWRKIVPVWIFMTIQPCERFNGSILSRPLLYPDSNF